MAGKQQQGQGGGREGREEREQTQHGRQGRQGQSGVTGGGEFSEGGGSGRSSTGSGTGGSSSESGSRSSSSESGGKSGRYSIDCSEAGQGCSLKVSGTYDEVVAAGVEHGRSAHGMTGDDKKLRKDIEGYIHEEQEPGSGMPGSYQGRGQSQSGASPSLPS